MPNRILKESICSSDSVDSLSWFEEVFFYRLIVNADDFGRLDARAAMLKSKLFPLKSVTDKQIGEALNKLSTVGMVQVYEYDQKPFLQLTAWNSHQQIRAKKSKYPAPASNGNQLKSNEIKCPRNPIQSNPIRESESNASNAHARTHEEPLQICKSSDFVKIKELCQVHCPVIFKRHEQKPNADHNLGMILDEVMATHSLSEIEEVLKHASKTYYVKAKMQNLDLCWVLDNLDKVKNTPIDEQMVNAPQLSEIPSPTRSYTSEEINARFDSLRAEDI